MSTTESTETTEAVADREEPLEQAEDKEVDPWIGRLLGERYRVIERIGQGGMGTVYVAEHLTLHKMVALKLVHEADGGEAHAQRFVREAMVTSLIEHPNVISAIDFGTFENGTAYLAMQLVRGPTLGRVLKDEQCLRWVRVADIGSQIADALCAAQAQGIVHRDLKPENVILQPMQDGSELVKLLDFGIAKHARDSLAPPPMQSTQAVTRIGVVIGTLGYMAPEQAVGKRADHRSDLYSLGALMWECVVGRRLWSSDDVQTLLAEQLNRPATSVRYASGDDSIPDAFEKMVASLLAINPIDRPQNPAEVRDGLRELCAAVKRGSLESAEPSLVRRAPILIDIQPATRVQRSPRERIEPLHVSIPVKPDVDERISSLLMPPPPAAAPPPIFVPPPLVSAPPLVVPPPAARGSAPQVPLAMRSFAQTRITTNLGVLRGRPLWLSIVGALLAVGVASWLTRGALSPEPKPAPKPVAEVEPKPVPVTRDLLGEEVRALLQSLVDGTGREQRVAAAEAVLRHVPVDEVPAYARAMAHLQLADTCAHKKEQLANIALVNDPRVLPVLISLAERKRGGCGPKGREDCLSCLRDELDALVKHFETMQMTPPKTP